MSQKPNKSYTRFQVGFLIVSVIYFGICIAAPKVRENRKEAERARIEAARDREVQRQHEQLMKEIEARRIQDSIEAPMRRVRDSIARAQQAQQEIIRQQQAEQTRREALRKQHEYEATAGYDEGFCDGYDCGYDDADCNESYGYSYLTDETLARHTRAYHRGFAAGYREGFDDGREDFDDSQKDKAPVVEQKTWKEVMSPELKQKAGYVNQSSGVQSASSTSVFDREDIHDMGMIVVLSVRIFPISL